MSALGVDSPNTTPIIATTWRRPTVAVVTLEGEHDMASVPQLEQALGNALLTCSQLVVDLDSVQFIDSSIIHTLIKMKREADDRRCDFRLVLNGDAPNIEQTLEICGVLGVLNRVATVDAALQHGSSSANLAPSLPDRPRMAVRGQAPPGWGQTATSA